MGGAKGQGAMRKVCEYEAHAAECRKMAARIKNPDQKRQLEEMAHAWDMMAGVRRKQLKSNSRSDAVGELVPPGEFESPTS